MGDDDGGVTHRSLARGTRAHRHELETVLLEDGALMIVELGGQQRPVGEQTLDDLVGQSNVGRTSLRVDDDAAALPVQADDLVTAAVFVKAKSGRRPVARLMR